MTRARCPSPRWLAAACLLVGWTTVASQAQPEPGGAAGDERLAVRVDAVFHDQVAESLLRQLSRRSRVSLTAAPETAWERVTLVVRQRPLREVMDGVAELLNARWRSDRVGEGPPRYRLVRSVEARHYEQELWDDLLEHSAEPLLRLARYAERPAEEWAALRDGDPAALPADPLLRPRADGSASGHLQDLSRPDSHAALRLLATLSAEQRRALLDAEQLFLLYRAMTAPQRELARAAVAMPSRIDDGPWLADLPDDAYQRKIERGRDWLERTGLRLAIWRDPQTGALNRYFAGTELGGGRGANLPGETFAASRQAVRGRPYPRPRGQAAEQYIDLERRTFPPEYRLDPARAPSWSDVVAELGRHLSLPLYSDDFAGTRDWGTLMMRAGEKPPSGSLVEALDALCRKHGKLWWREGNALHFHSRAWFLEKRYEVPPSVLARLGEQIDPERGLSPAAVSTLARLSLQQLQGLSAATVISGRRGGSGNLDRGRAHFWTSRAYPFLLLAATLSEAQRRQVLGEGLRRAQMTPPQWEAFLTLAVYHNGLRALDRPEDLRFRLRSYPARKPTRPGEPWTTTGMLQLTENGMGSLFSVSFTPPERRLRPRLPQRGTP